MTLFIILMLFTINPLDSFRLKNSFYTHISQFNIESYNDSLFRNPLPGEEIKLPGINEPSGEFLLDRPLIHKIATLRTFIESIEFNYGKKPSDDSVDYSNISTSEDSSDEQNQDESKFVEINEENLEPINDLLVEEDLLEEVLNNAFETYKKSNDLEAIDRLSDIAEKIAPIAAKLRKNRSELNITRLISCYTDGNEDLDMVLEELMDKKALDKYLLKRLDELIHLAAKKYRISNKHPAVSEEFLKVLKDRISAQRITNIRGTDLFVKTLALCFQKETDEEWDQIIKENIRTVENLEQFHEWLEDGIEYCRRNNKIEDKIDKMERIMDIIVRQHPIWNPKEDYIEYEDSPNKHFDPEKEREKIEKMIEGKR